MTDLRVKYELSLRISKEDHLEVETQPFTVQVRAAGRGPLRGFIYRESTYKGASVDIAIEESNVEP